MSIYREERSIINGNGTEISENVSKFFGGELRTVNLTAKGIQFRKLNYDVDMESFGVSNIENLEKFRIDAG